MAFAAKAVGGCDDFNDFSVLNAFNVLNDFYDLHDFNGLNDKNGSEFTGELLNNLRMSPSFTLD